jgi:hypothetical protein
MKGIDNKFIIDTSIAKYTEYNQVESMKAWLKLSRQNFKNQSCQFLKLKGMNNIIKKIEHPLLTKFYEHLMKGEYFKAVEIVESCFVKGFFDYYIKTLPYKVLWSRLDLLDNLIDKYADDINYEMRLIKKTNRKFINILENEGISIIQNIPNSLNEEDVNLEESMSLTFLDNLDSPNLDDNLESILTANSDENPVSYPCPRAGHCMALDEENLVIYIFGGWTGVLELNDFWSFDIRAGKWLLISANTYREGGPGLSSCGRMIYDTVFKRILIFGKFGTDLQSKFDNCIYEYSVQSNKWQICQFSKEKIGNNFVESNGPGQVYDHQMILDSYLQKLYIFGGIRVPEFEGGN